MKEDLGIAKTEAAAIAALCAEQAVPFILEVAGVPVVMTPAGWVGNSYEKNLPAPTRRKGTGKLATVDALARFIALFPEAPTVVYTDRAKCALRAVFNPDTAEGPGWCDWWAVVEFQIDPCLKRWKELAGKWLTQEQFGEFLRERGVDIIDPVSGVVVDLVENLETHTGVMGKFKRDGRTGSRTLMWEEDTKAKTEVPEKFILKLPAFLLSDTMIEVECRLNYRAKDAALHWQFLIDEFEAALDAAWDAEVEKLAKHPELPAGVAKRIFAAA